MPSYAVLRQEAAEKIRRISPRKLPIVLDFLSYLEDREGWNATMEILSDPQMRRDVEEGLKQAKRKQGTPWREIRAKI